ncbi:MAG: polyprenyl synthetase family protein [Planctomycetaceae bacterium]
MTSSESIVLSPVAESLSKVKDFVEPLLCEALDRVAATLDKWDTIPAARLVESMRYSLLAPGKRLRPALVLWAAEAAGGTWSEAGPAAAAVEMIHAYSLVHDDLPAMDDDDLRRGRPTCHRAYDEATAILCGDALQALAFETLADGLPDVIAARACRVLAHAAGAANLVGGQAGDLAAEREISNTADSNGRLSGGADADGQLARLESIHRRKTGALFLASLELGGLAAGANHRTLACLAGYGKAFGLAFQIADDLLDAEGCEQAAGKRVGKDAARGKLAFPGLVGLHESRRRALTLVDEAVASISTMDRSKELTALARWIVERDH